MMMMINVHALSCRTRFHEHRCDDYLSRRRLRCDAAAVSRQVRLSAGERSFQSAVSFDEPTPPYSASVAGS